MEQKRYKHLLFFIAFVDMLGFGLLLPIMPFIALNLKANPFQIGLLTAIFPFFQIFFMPVWGHLTDKFGTRKILLISLLGNAFSFALFALSNNFGLLLFSRGLAGITSATLGIIRGSLTEPKNFKSTSENMKLFGSFQGLGILLGPIIGSVLQLHSLKAPVWFAVLICLVAFILVLRNSYFPKPYSEEQIDIATKIKTTLQNLRLRYMTLLYFMIYFSFSLLFISYPLFLKDSYQYGPIQSSIFFGLLSFSAILGQMLVLTRMQKFFSTFQILKIAFLILALGIYFMSIKTTGTLSGLLIIFVGIFLFVAIPSLLTEIGINSKEEEKNFTASLSESVSGLARLSGAFISGLFIQNIGISSAFYLSSLMAFLGLIIVLNFEKKVVVSPL